MKICKKHNLKYFGLCCPKCLGDGTLDKYFKGGQEK